MSLDMQAQLLVQILLPATFNSMAGNDVTVNVPLTFASPAPKVFRH